MSRFQFELIQILSLQSGKLLPCILTIQRCKSNRSNSNGISFSLPARTQRVGDLSGTINRRMEFTNIHFKGNRRGIAWYISSRSWRGIVCLSVKCHSNREVISSLRFAVSQDEIAFAKSRKGEYGGYSLLEYMIYTDGVDI